jgi:class 3 adenylate cyclase
MADDARLEDLIRVESNAAVRTGALVGLVIAGVTFGFGAALALVRGELSMRPVFPFLIALFAAAAFFFARRGQLRGTIAWAIFIVGALMPSAYLLVCELVMPFGAATFLFAPVVWSYLIMTPLSAFAMNARLTRTVGVISAVGYLFDYLLARNHLAQLPLLDSFLQEDLTSPVIHILRAVLIFFAGILAAALCTTSRRLLDRVRNEEREKASISRLFGEYVSPEVKDKLLEQISGVKGERCTVAVLFSDLRGFTTFSEGKEPVQVVEQLNQYFDRMVSAITRHGGTVDKFIGDAVMATFGGLIKVDNPAASALAACMEMRAELATLNKEWASQGIPALDNGIGVHFGEVLQGPIGSATRKEFTVIGDVVNTASRLESATKELGHPVVFSAAAAEALPEHQRTALKPLGEVALKGKKEPVKVFGAAA